MANFIPSKKEAKDFNNGVAYIGEDKAHGIAGDAVQAETINNIIESILYLQKSKSIKKIINQSSSNISISTDNKLTVTDSDIIANSHIDLYPADVETETFLSEHLVSNIIRVEADHFNITLDSELPSEWSMYYIITEVQ